jgi:hypothetical protein
MFSVLAIGSIIMVTGVLLLIPISLETVYAQRASPAGNSTSNKTSISVSQLNGPFQGNSIKLFVIVSFVKDDQWKTIDNYASHGWDIKSIVPFFKRYIVVLEKEETKLNQTRS